MAFCANCGAEVVGKFCAKCGAPAPAGAPAPPPPASPQGGNYPPQSGYQPQGGYNPPPPQGGSYAPPQGGYAPPPGGGYVPPQGGYPPPPGGYAPQAQAAGLTDNVAAALSYVTIIGIVFLFIEPYNRNRNLRFHCFQSIFFCLAAIVVEIATGIVMAVMFAIPGLGLIFGLLRMIVSLGIFIVWLILVYKAYNNENFVLPVIGPMAQKQA